MKKNTEIVEFFICPNCKKAGWERVDFIPFKCTDEYACLAECDYCGKEILVVDHISRCSLCNHKVECMAIPLKHTTIIAAVRAREVDLPAIKKILEILDCYSNV